MELLALNWIRRRSGKQANPSRHLIGRVRSRQQDPEPKTNPE
jgi:hypothetical protein